MQSVPSRHRETFAIWKSGWTLGSGSSRARISVLCFQQLILYFFLIYVEEIQHHTKSWESWFIFFPLQTRGKKIQELVYAMCPLPLTCLLGGRSRKAQTEPPGGVCKNLNLSDSWKKKSQKVIKTNQWKLL